MVYLFLNRNCIIGQVIRPICHIYTFLTWRFKGQKKAAVKRKIMPKILSGINPIVKDTPPKKNPTVSKRASLTICKNHRQVLGLVINFQF